MGQAHAHTAQTTGIAAPRDRRGTVEVHYAAPTLEREARSGSIGQSECVGGQEWEQAGLGNEHATWFWEDHGDGTRSRWEVCGWWWAM